MEQVIKANFSLKTVVFNIVCICLLTICGLWISQEWTESYAPLPEAKVIKLWNPSSYEPLVLTNSINAKWQSSTPLFATDSRKSFLQKNVGEVVLYYTLHQDLPGGILTYYGKTAEGNIVFYKEPLVIGSLIKGSNFYWKIRVDKNERVVKLSAQEKINGGLVLSIGISLVLCIIMGFIIL